MFSVLQRRWEGQTLPDSERRERLPAGHHYRVRESGGTGQLLQEEAALSQDQAALPGHS